MGLVSQRFLVSIFDINNYCETLGVNKVLPISRYIGNDIISRRENYIE